MGIVHVRFLPYSTPAKLLRLPALNGSLFPAEFLSHRRKAGQERCLLMLRIHVFDRSAQLSDRVSCLADFLILLEVVLRHLRLLLPEVHRIDVGGVEHRVGKIHCVSPFVLV